MTHQVDTIDMTPTFEEATAMCIAVLENGSVEGKAQARKELIRYGRELDRLVAGGAGASFDVTDTPISDE